MTSDKHNEQLRVVYVTISLPEPSERFATNEVRLLASHGVSISVHGLRREHRHAAQLREEAGLSHLRSTHNGIRTSLVGGLAALRRPGLLLRALGWTVRSNATRPRDLVLSLLLLPRAFDILQTIEREQPDVVHMYWGHYPAIVGYLVQLRLPEISTSISIVAYDLAREYGGAVEVARNADVVRTHAEINKAHVVRFTGVAPERVEVLYNGVDVAWVEGIRRRHEKVRQRIVTAARLVPEKGTDDVLLAFAEIRHRWPDASLVVVGDGPDRPRLDAMCQRLEIVSAVRFLGHVPHERVVEEMAQAEVVLLLSRCGGERLPNAVKEGMASHCICITTPSPGIDELVRDGVTGFVVAENDAPAASSIVDALFAGRIDAQAMAGRAAEHIESRFDLNQTAPRYKRLWAAAIRNRRTSRKATPEADPARAAAP